MGEWVVHQGGFEFVSECGDSIFVSSCGEVKLGSDNPKLSSEDNLSSATKVIVGLSDASDARFGFINRMNPKPRPVALFGVAIAQFFRGEVSYVTWLKSSLSEVESGVAAVLSKRYCVREVGEKGVLDNGALEF